MFRRASGGQKLPIGDVMPFFDHERGEYHLLYLAPTTDSDALLVRLDKVGWGHISSFDLREWVEHPAVLFPDRIGVDDAGVITGSVIRVGSDWHVFYGATSRSEPDKQVICHASGSDLESLVKDPMNPVLVATDGFEPNDWRDPFVFWNEAAVEYWMLISARLDHGPHAIRGAVARARSKDLSDWSVDTEPFFAPMSTSVPECPELFRLGDEWILGFCAYTQQAGSQYYRSSTPDGPWKPVPQNRESAVWYAAKSLTDASGRVISFGWIGDREQESNDGRIVWGGDLSLPREVVVSEGQLGQRLVTEWCDSGELVASSSFRASAGDWEINTGRASQRSPIPLAVVDLNTFGRNGRYTIEFTASLANSDRVGSFGIAIVESLELEQGVSVTVDIATGCALMEQWNSDWTHLVERPSGPWARNLLPLDEDATVRVRLVRDGSVVEAFINDSIAMSHRWYGSPELPVILWTRFAEVSFEEIRLSKGTDSV